MAMDRLQRLAIKTGEKNLGMLLDLLESSKSVILARRFPFSDWPEDVEPRYYDLQVRIALALYEKIGASYETSHSENSVTRHWGSESVPAELLSEITPKVGV